MTTGRPAGNLPIMLAAVAIELLGVVVAFTRSVPLGLGLISIGSALTVVVLMRHQIHAAEQRIRPRRSGPGRPAGSGPPTRRR